MNPTAPTSPAPDSATHDRITALELRVREQTARADSAAAELQEFASALSHDLRAPLRGIAGFARILAEDHAPQLGPEGRRILDMLRAEVQSMGEHLEGLLAFSRAGRQPLDPEAIDLTVLAQGTLLDLSEALPTPAPACAVQPLPSACGDRGLVRQVLSQLLGNAIKFSARQPAPRIAVTGWTADGMSVVCVADNGAGFDPRYADKLFGVFQRLHSQEEFPGAGMGLATVRRIVQRHGGKVWAEAPADGGAKFFFTLPTTGATLP